MLETWIETKYLVNALVFSGVGLVIFAVTFAVLELITPKVSIWKELVEKQNVAFAIFFAAVMLGIAIIISSAIHG